MPQFEYSVQRLTPPSLRYDAVEDTPPTGAIVKLQTQAPVGAYPDIEQHLASAHAVALNSPLTFTPALGDTFDQASATWTYLRGKNTVFVVDPPRIVAEIYRSKMP